MTDVTRRKFMSMMSAGGATLTIAPLLALQATRATGATPAGEPAFGPGFGPIAPKLPLNTSALNNAFIGDLRNVPILALPDGFEYTVVSNMGDMMSDGTLVPGDHDGMATFSGPNATTIVVRNHELAPTGGDALKPPVVAPANMKYDPVCLGGTTTMVFDAQGRLLRDFASIAGTFNNCAGGLTPWGTWITCEENTSVPPQSSVTRKHGYNFEVRAYHEGLSEPVALVDMGRFNHEAIAVDPVTGWVYQTEDRGDSCLYRFRPNVMGDLRSGGVLEALRLVDFPGIHTVTGFGQNLFKPLAADWVKIDDVDPAADTLRLEAQSKGAARFSRGEGAWYGNGKIYFVCSNGGDAGRGQVFAYDPLDSTLTLFVESVASPSGMDTDNGGFLLAAPDNITVGPDGRVYLCEDGSGVEKVVGVGLDGQLFEVARNLLNGNEFGGACFSHDGRFMFVNIQGPGLTCVIRGNWRQGRRF